MPARAAVVGLVVAGIGALGLLTSGGESRRPHNSSASTGDLARLLERFESGVPGPGSDAYRSPPPAESRTLAEAFGALRVGDLDRSEMLARRVGYTVDTLESGRYGVLREARSDNRGWGLYVQRLHSNSRLVVEVVHPRSDIDTVALGGEAFERAKAGSLLVAGAHRREGRRRSADAAHSPMNPLAVVNASALRPGDVVLQPHGFGGRRHNDRLGDAVVSSGTSDPQPPAAKLAQALEDRGLDVCLYRGARCGDLAGRTNVEGVAARRKGAAFVHVELRRWSRAEGAGRETVVDAITKAFGRAAR